MSIVLPKVSDFIGEPFADPEVDWVLMTLLGLPLPEPPPLSLSILAMLSFVMVTTWLSPWSRMVSVQ